ncbi:hypothetical protein RN001_007430 [Aquatica leii]|uniref:Caspase-8 n=1 Tax=Aquatica leii TaxID=1421715 RepID=A0AAN7SGT9_9COLE|nr:hypothetical protein RN001_007430 [Aquatica leii]
MSSDNITTDANHVLPTSKETTHFISFTIQQVTEIEQALDLMEKISLVYLLYDHVEIALQSLIQLLNGTLLNVIVEWAKQAVKTRNWHEKLIEALSIIQNFYIIENLGYKEKEVCDRFLPMNSNTSLFIHLYKKKLYRIFETMTNNQLKTFLSHVHNDFKHKQLIHKEFPMPYIEIYLLYWQSIRYITSSDLTNISKPFKIMEMFDIADTLTETTKLSGDSMLTSTSVISSTPIQKNDSWNNYEDKKYLMDPQNPGICLIINQENFYTEPDPQWAHLLPKDNIRLNDRDGTVFDCSSLKNTFEKFGYTIVIRNNLTHEELLEAVVETVNMIRKHSSLIVCILSHGLEGIVYGVNSIPVEISKIRNTICTTNTRHLKTKPKVLILQSCQGNECQVVSDDEDNEEEAFRPVTKIEPSAQVLPSLSYLQYDDGNIEMDGGSRPKTADVLLFWATVPGYGAVRDTSRGSWFIQSLCSHIQQRGHEMHFEDICTLVKQEVIDKRWKTPKSIRAMVPNKESTLSRFFFLPPIRMTLNS